VKQIEAAKADGRWHAAYPPASRMEVPEDLAAALEANPEAKAAVEALKGGERYSVLYRLHQVQSAVKRRAAVKKVVAGLRENWPRTLLTEEPRAASAIVCATSVLA
jgi:uncharacterized protein YdeI (YjbR/CyaY-like superfamily)